MVHPPRGNDSARLWRVQCVQSTPRAKRPPRCRSQQAREAHNSSPPFYMVRWPAIFPGTFKVDSSEMSPCALNSGGGAPGCFPAASTPMAGNNMRQWDQGALRNAQQGVVYPLLLLIWFVDGQGYRHGKGGAARRSGVAATKWRRFCCREVGRHQCVDFYDPTRARGLSSIRFTRFVLIIRDQTGTTTGTGSWVQGIFSRTCGLG